MESARAMGAKRRSGEGEEEAEEEEEEKKNLTLMINGEWMGGG
jgi:hypothetical protein